MECVFKVVVLLISKTYGEQLRGVRRRLSVGVRTAISLQRENGGRESDLRCLPFGVFRYLDRWQIVLPAVFKSWRGLTLQKIWNRSLDQPWHHAVCRREGPG